MNEAYRHAPLTLPGTPLDQVVRDGWNVTLRFRDEGDGPWIVDLSHVPKWDLQGSALDRTPGLEGIVPAQPGSSTFHEGWIINRLNPVQAGLWRLRPDAPPLGGCPRTPQAVTPAQAGVHQLPEILDPRFRGDDEWALEGENAPFSDNLLAPKGVWTTDLTDGLVLLALAGPGALDVMERVASLDLRRPDISCPVVFQGPVCHVPTQVVLPRREDLSALVLLAFSRGYGPSVAEALLHAGDPLGLRPAGEERFFENLVSQ
ncbi:hypothetical protein SAMN02745206_03361 [Desulfacinum infernum DSM 9756]|uniref:Uncharacterized protein n=1 Tax=Desulfacinum infernum DSM 9756 TaxID=1121391 RepID=A0A1M5HHC0_9BACT|nr:hypothetical protein [Desulfacinum infernum]SHG15321.1 hypothetical protein SAMN02745206_03361 [Desulfacinum infernum DSM 9756]